MADREKAIDKIRKLLALAKSSNEHEASVAAAAAARMMAQHGIDSVTEIEPEADPVGDNRDMAVEIGLSRRLVAWKWNLAWVVGESARCKPYALDRTFGDEYTGKLIAFIGRRSDAELCSLLFSHLLGEVKRLHDARRPSIGQRIQRYIPGQLPPIVDRAYQRQWSRNFYMGVVTVLSTRMSAASADVMRTASSTALVRLGNVAEKVDAVASELGLQYVKAREVTVSSQHGFVAGVNAGHQIDLRRGSERVPVGRALPGRTKP